MAGPIQASSIRASTEGDVVVDLHVGGEARAALSGAAAREDVVLDAPGARILDRRWEALPVPSQTDLRLHAPDGDVRSVREIARGWVQAASVDETITLSGAAGPLRGPEALEQALAADLLAPLPETPLAEHLSAPLPDDARRVVITTAPPTGPLSSVEDRLVHVVVLQRPDFDPPEARLAALRRAVRGGGGQARVFEAVDTAAAHLAGLPADEPLRLRLTLRLCREADASPDHLALSSPVVGLDAQFPLLRSALPPCPAPPGTVAPTVEPGAPGGFDLRLLLPVGLGLVVLAGGGLFLLRRRRPGLVAEEAADAEPVEDEEVAPGRLLAPVDPDADMALVVLRGAGLVGSRIPLGVGSLSVGATSGNDALIDLSGISGRHARFERFPGGDVFVLDADSANGTWVGGRRLERGERVRLREGDRVALGPSLELELVVQEEPE